jgi:putative ABC transport system permease protein
VKDRAVLPLRRPGHGSCFEVGRVWTLAWKMLLHDRVKFAVAAAGVSVSVWLVLVQVGLYYGFMENASTLIDHAQADIWVAGEGNENFDFTAPVNERVFYRVAEAPGVARAERVLLAFGQFRRFSDGGTLGVEVVGLERGARLLVPWNVTAGDARHIADVDGVVVDRGEFPKLRIDRVGARGEISAVRARVVALTEGIRSFTTSPFVFTNLETARAYVRWAQDQIAYVLVKVAPGADVEAVRARLDRLPYVAAYTKPEFSERTRSFWSERTGVGTGFFMTAVMGVLVGLVVVGQILYNGTLEHIREYGTLKAMGVKNGGIVRVILVQAQISALVGLVIGGGMAFVARSGMRGANLFVVLSPTLLVTTVVLTSVMCSLAALLSINKVLKLEPASVFKG